MKERCMSLGAVLLARKIVVIKDDMPVKKACMREARVKARRARTLMLVVDMSSVMRDMFAKKACTGMEEELVKMKGMCV
jgi:hypothetical protein